MASWWCGGQRTGLSPCQPSAQSHHSPLPSPTTARGSTTRLRTLVACAKPRVHPTVGIIQESCWPPFPRQLSSCQVRLAAPCEPRGEQSSSETTRTATVHGLGLDLLRNCDLITLFGRSGLRVGLGSKQTTLGRRGNHPCPTHRARPSLPSSPQSQTHPTVPSA